MLLTEDEIKATVSAAFKRGLVVEPAGTAALAAILTGKVWKTNWFMIQILQTRISNKLGFKSYYHILWYLSFQNTSQC